MCKPETNDEEKETLKFHYNLEKYMNYGTRLSILPILYFLYRKKYFDKKSLLFKREIALIAGGMILIGGGDYLANELMWGNTEAIVRRHNQIIDKYYIDNEKLKEVKQQMRTSNQDKLY